ncbi:hypothetical protein GWO43_02235, partial [candidate division KSB1 bacterium]|nr:hypothetical protein [candidate division KSB1 bacterium]NIR69660.1 hypothetical protein [candidate division KSB1 bacterium]NIS22889.1 hypothetical protein [candidate division KSB1 bacterium]NIT69728.1 hypothetical protein [candidate division KSB1 bacterium]NIU23395.1 hypothetical protein [candidate division KSB1 bacterium]
MKTPSNIAFVVTLLLISFSYALGQEEERVKVGDRVRVLTPVSVISSRGGEKHENSWFEGTLDSLDADALILKLEDQNARLVVPLASLKRLEVCRDCKSRTPAGASLGFLGGAIAGA